MLLSMLTLSRWRRTTSPLTLVVLGFVAAGHGMAANSKSTHGRSIAVAVFPIPGSHYNRPATQIVFRGVPRRAIGRVTVVGSRSGVHTGRVEADSDGHGASFMPARPFRVGETVTVKTRLNILGGTRGRFSFTIGNVAPLIRCAQLGGIPRARPGDLAHFASRPDLRPVSVRVTTDQAPSSEGDIFVGPQNGPVQNGPMILDPHGGLIWFLPSAVSKGRYANDFRVQDLHGRPVLTWWQGCRNSGIGLGSGVIVGRSYRRLATVNAANGLAEDSHELLVTPQGDAYITATSPVRLRITRPPTIDWVVQEVDLKTGLLLFEWHALDHVPLSASWVSVRSAQAFYDPYHLNSISLASDGNLLVSMRNTNAAYLIDHRSGRVLWTLGGKHSSFSMGAGTRTWAQHDAVLQPDGTVTIFDNGGGLPFVHPQSRGIRERIDARQKTATLIREYDHDPSLRVEVEGGMQLLPDGNAFIGWGAQRYFSEYDPSGRQIFDAHFTDPIASYRRTVSPGGASRRADRPSPSCHVGVPQPTCTQVGTVRPTSPRGACSPARTRGRSGSPERTRSAASRRRSWCTVRTAASPCKR
jgi:hypothetical protein